eukprot:CAMPEP_0171332290 /NCGR_PEP_ID=MMETSP0878-20121228/3255_1 /TAXON_ID=67004 /ORGANISM="Thalassiosira weissflogii, Strain CCMP1336" /LENGTH=640 /DNA_ID=CAMNT_0011832989 /DNA_START=300 /DNA_END=2222 /DNA_ORIENTATION=-
MKFSTSVVLSSAATATLAGTTASVAAFSSHRPSSFSLHHPQTRKSSNYDNCALATKLFAENNKSNNISTSSGDQKSPAKSATTLNFKDEKNDVGEGGDGSWNIGVASKQLDENAKKKKVAKDALKKLLERQQRDVQQTLDLIKSLDLEDEPTSSLSSPSSSPNNLHSNHTTFTNSSSLSIDQLLKTVPTIATSVASGADYGFLSRSEGCRFSAIDKAYLNDPRFDGYGPPGNVFQLGSQQFMRNLRAMFHEYREEEDNPSLTKRQRELQAKLEELTLNSEAIWERERSRGEIVAPWIIKIPYFVLCYFLDVVFEGKNAFSRFFLLETVARMPYFSYITMLHLYETLGFWRRSSDVKRIHFAEEWNEFHHLLIMESLGGDQPYWVRFLSQHSALAYYIGLCILWMLSPSLSYKFSEMLETHAVDTYGQFIDENEAKLKELPPSLAAIEYYTVGVSDPMFGEYQTASVSDPERGIRKSGTNLQSLYDVFVAIRNDEGDHVSTMKSCLDPKEPVLSPALESRALTGVALASSVGFLLGSVGDWTQLADFVDSASSGIDLDNVLTESATRSSPILDGIIGGIASFANGLKEMAGDGADLDVDEDAAGSFLEDVVGGGATDGIEMEAILEVAKKVVLSILEVIRF